MTWEGAAAMDDAAGQAFEELRGLHGNARVWICSSSGWPGGIVQLATSVSVGHSSQASVGRSR